MPRPRGFAVKSREILAALITGSGGTGTVAQLTGRSRQLIGALASGRVTSTSEATADALSEVVKVPRDQLFIPPQAEESATRKELG